MIANSPASFRRADVPFVKRFARDRWVGTGRNSPPDSDLPLVNN
jgi:hypothetical protein